MDIDVISDVALKALVNAAIMGVAWFAGNTMGSPGHMGHFAHPALVYPYAVLLWLATSSLICALIMISMPDINIDIVQGYLIALLFLVLHGLMKGRDSTKQ